MPRRTEDDRGTVLILMPAAVLIVIVLGAFAVDATIAFLAERELANLSAGIANDIAGAALDNPTFYETGTLRLNPTHAQRITTHSLSTYTPQYLQAVRATNLTLTANRVTLTLTATAPYLLSPALPTTPKSITLSATSTATAQQE